MSELGDEIVRQLDEMQHSDSEAAHMDADVLVLAALGVLGGEEGKRIVEAYDRLKARADFWYA